MLASTGAKINIMPDWTVFVQLGIFLLTMAVLHLLVFRPVLRVLDRRRAFTDDAMRDAAEKNREAEALEAVCEARVAEALEAAEAEREAALARARAEAEAIVADAKAQMKSLMGSTEISVESSEAAAVSEIKKRAEELAGEIASRVTSPGGVGRA